LGGTKSIWEALSPNAHCINGACKYIVKKAVEENPQKQYQAFPFQIDQGRQTATQSMPHGCK